MLTGSVGGELRVALEALRDHLAEEMDAGVVCKACGGSVSSPTAALAKQLRDTLVALSALPYVKESVSDDLKAKRAARQAGLSDGASSGGVDGAGSNRVGGKRRATP